MLKDLKEKSRGEAGFTLMELIIVIAILAMLIGMLLPRFANYTDKAMGATAGVDAKNIMTIVSAYNLDNEKRIGITELQKETGINGTGVGGKTLTDPGANGIQFLYVYKRGGATVTALIDVQSSYILYVVQGADGSSFSTGGTPDGKTQAGRIAKGIGL